MQLIESVPYMGTGTTVGYTSNMGPLACSSIAASPAAGSAAVSSLGLCYAVAGQQRSAIVLQHPMLQEGMLQGVLPFWSCILSQLPGKDQWTADITFIALLEVCRHDSSGAYERLPLQYSLACHRV